MVYHPEGYAESKILAEAVMSLYGISSFRGMQKAWYTIPRGMQKVMILAEMVISLYGISSFRGMP